MELNKKTRKILSDRINSLNEGKTMSFSEMLSSFEKKKEEGLDFMQIIENAKGMLPDISKLKKKETPKDCELKISGDSEFVIECIKLISGNYR